MPMGGILPQDVHPYLAMMVIGFVVGTAGHVMRARWLVAIGIALVFFAALLFPLALNLFGGSPQQPPGPTPTPY